MANAESFRVGKVRAYRRGRIWYLCYYECGRRHRPRVGPDRKMARKLAAQINGQIEVGAPGLLSFEPVSIPDLRDLWLQHHEHVLRSSIQTVHRYRTASEHLVRFIREVEPVRLASQFNSGHASKFVRYLRSVEVSPNGHRNSLKRPLLDHGIQYILETARTLFNFARKRRHLSPYADNPFADLELDRLRIENARPIVLFGPDEEQRFLKACDEWQFPIFLTLLCTGLRPGELTHLLFPDDLDLNEGWLRVRNKARLGWQVKTRNERSIPLVPAHLEILRHAVRSRPAGPVFRRRRFMSGPPPALAGMSRASLEAEFVERLANHEKALGRKATAFERHCASRKLWTDMGAVKEDRIRQEFMRLTARIGLADATAPKLLRHMFATCLQDANVDPLIRNELMGHSSSIKTRPGGELGMTAVYTHTRRETSRRQLISAVRLRPAYRLAEEYVSSLELAIL